jgi:hypothetical protein
MIKLWNAITSAVKWCFSEVTTDTLSTEQLKDMEWNQWCDM